jgi:hypothetical protein
MFKITGCFAKKGEGWISLSPVLSRRERGFFGRE